MLDVDEVFVLFHGLTKADQNIVFPSWFEVQALHEGSTFGTDQ